MESIYGEYREMLPDVVKQLTAWIPNGVFTVADTSEIPEEYATGLEIGVLKFAADEDLKVIFSEVPNDGSSTLADVIEAMKAEKENFFDVVEAKLNGINAVSFTTKDANGENIKNATFEVSDSVWLNMKFRETDNLEFNQAVLLISASVAPVE